MLPRKHRLTQDKDVTRVLRKGRAVVTNLLTIKAVDGQGLTPRAAIVVGLKVHKRSTKRNLIKRRLRVIVQKLLPAFKVNVDFVIVALPESVGRKQADLAAAVEYCLKKLGIV